MLATVPSATLLGVDGRAVAVEVHVSAGLPAFTIVGLPDTACREARDRVRAALQSSGLDWPMKRVTVNLAPSGVRKAGAGLDLAIAVALLAASEQLDRAAVEGWAMIGELGLDGTVRRVPGIVPLVDAVAAPRVVVPAGCEREAALVGRHEVRGGETLTQVLEALRGVGPWPEVPPPAPVPPATAPDLADVRGQRLGRWALEIAAAGGHHLLLTGPPGSGKTMLARRLPGILPALDHDAALATTKIHSAAGQALPPGGLIDRPPLRAPHHGASFVSLIGGGSAAMRPGEVSLAHNGVLFMDEVAEFATNTLDAMRQPLEEGVVRVCRAAARVSFPARFLLVAAMNPCPCGEGGPPGSCRCTTAARGRYVRRLSGPLLDRFDLRLPVARPEVGELLGGAAGEPSAAVAERVAIARRRARRRGVATNADLRGAALEAATSLSAGAARLLEYKLRVGVLSARGLARVRRVARTIADLADREAVGEEDVCGALELRAEIGLLQGAA